MKKFFDWNYNPVLFCCAYWGKQIYKIFKCLTDKNYDPKYWHW